jgi:multidrug efflux system outer membrane protein
VGPTYRRPNVNSPTVFRGAPSAAQQSSLADLPWWELFRDDTLKELVKTALANNYDLEIAVARVEQSRQVAAEARSEYWPAIGYTNVTSYGHNQFVNSPASNSPGAQGFLLGIVRASWEADLWGRIRRTNEAARAELRETEDIRRGVMLTVVSDTSEAYFELLGLRLKLEIAKATAQSFAETVNLFTIRLRDGIGNSLQTSRATADQAGAAANIPQLERLIALKENEISILTGKNPGPIESKVNLLDEGIPLDVPAGLPSALLERRPDVLAAAQSLRAANARIGVARSAYFPQVGLTTFFGKLSTPLADLSSGNTNAWSLASNIGGPIFQGGAIKALNRQAFAAWEQARAEFFKTAVSAFRDVSDALISRARYDDARVEQLRAVRSGEEAVRVSLLRFKEGLSSYIEVLEAQQRLYPAQLALAETEVNRRLVVVQLYKALGGGWRLTDLQWMAARP